MMEAYGRVIPYLRYSKCLAMELVIDVPIGYSKEDSAIDREKLLKLLALTQNSIRVDLLHLEMRDIDAKFVEGRRRKQSRTLRQPITGVGPSNRSPALRPRLQDRASTPQALGRPFFLRQPKKSRWSCSW